MAAETTTLRIALAQVNPTVGDVEGNAALVGDWTNRAREAKAELVVFPELVISGYPAEDLWLKPHFLDACRTAVEDLAGRSEGIVSLVGFPERDAGVRNSVAVLADGHVHGTYQKCLLPNYGVFDERRYFDPGPGPALIEIAGVRIGLTICEDIWLPGPPASVEALAGASLIVNPSASPYLRGRGIFRERMVAERALQTGAAYALCNTVGGQDELVFDGHSVIVSAAGETVARGGQFAEDLVVCDVELPVATGSSGGEAAEPLPVEGAPPVIASFELSHPGGRIEPRSLSPILDDRAEVYTALTLGLRDYARKNRFDRALVAVSGGIDSALVALVAADALGPEHLTCVVMPSPHSSAATQEDARAIAANLGAEIIEIPIAAAMEAYQSILPDAAASAAATDGADVGAGGAASAEDLTAENLQARIRGNLMMALSNRTGWLVLTTGNKSEMSVGYATLYGDMAGGFAVIKDVPKTLVYELVRYRHEREGRDLVPASVLERAPSAELRPEQRDDDSLPPYEVLDPILEAYIENDRGRDEIVAAGASPDVVDRVLAMVDGAEYKRRQAPPGIKITPKAFGRDRRLPITNRYRG
jgi:NAD+ synthase (glutamine-hydrolysing)